MILATDVDYREDGSAAAGVLFRAWTTADVERLVTQKVDAVRPYRTGHFFERELPGILALLSGIDGTLDAIIVDGYVWLGPDRAPGLRAHLFKALNEKVPVIGVAKTRFKATPPEAEVLRGQSARPLYVTSAGVDHEVAKAWIQSMHGQYRVPTLLAAVDRVCRALA